MPAPTPLPNANLAQLREASYALGASRLQALRWVLLPAAARRLGAHVRCRLGPRFFFAALLALLPVFVRPPRMENGIVVGGIAMAAVVLPVMIFSARVALKSVPSELKEAALALGASRWQVMWRVVFPLAIRSFLTNSWAGRRI